MRVMLQTTVQWIIGDVLSGLIARIQINHVTEQVMVPKTTISDVNKNTEMVRQC
jgi:hypothetical protein